MSHRTDRRRRKKHRERKEAPSVSESAFVKVVDGKPRDIELFRDPAETVMDLRLVRRAVNRDWDVPPERCGWIIEQVMSIVQQKGDASEVESDRNSILACATMLDMYLSARRGRKKAGVSR